MNRYIFWMHEYKNNFYYNYIIKNSDHIIVTNSAIKTDIIQYCNIPSNLISLSLNPITKSQLNTVKSRREARIALGLDENKIYIVYTGKLFIGMEEVESILKVAKNLKNYTFIFTGGRKLVVRYYKNFCRDNHIRNTIFTGFITRYIDVRLYQFSADILVSFYTSNFHFTKYNLPNKISEYMLTKNAIVTPDYPATKDLLDSTNCKFVDPDDVTSLTNCIEFLAKNPGVRKKLGLNAFNKIKNYTYKNISSKILEELG